MPTLSASEIAGIIKYYNTGGESPIAPISDKNAIIAIAIALAESSGNPEAVGKPNSNGTRDWGLWQINDIHNPTHRQKTSAAANWLYAWRIAGMGTSWTPWSSYKSQNGKPPTYLAYMDTARSAWGSATPGTIGGNASGEVLNPETETRFTGPLAPLNPILALTKGETWQRVGMALAGLLLIAIVLAAILKTASPIGQITKAIK
jgi:hypothetical protein